MEWAVLLLTLIAAVLVGYIAGKGAFRTPPQQPRSQIDHPDGSAASGGASASSASGARRKSKAARVLQTPRKSSAAAGLSIAPTDGSTLVSPTPAAATAAFVHALPTPVASPIQSPEASRAGTPTGSPKGSRRASDAAEAAAAATESAAAAAASAAASNLSAAASASPPSESEAVSDDDESDGGADGEGSRRASRASKRIVIVAKQLPVFTRRDPATGRWTVEWEDNRSFLSGLRTLRSRGLDVKWVGVPNTSGEALPKDEQEDYEELLLEHDCVPVFLLPGLADKFFNHFCKGVLWPMLHYVLPQSNAQFSAKWDELWQAYTAANALFASVVSHCVDSPTDTIFIHNYHLLLLPSFLRTKLPRAKIGLFIHTPFPSSDVFRVLPTRQNILSSIMAADLLGFHTFDYARHFLSCTKRVMDLDFETLAGGALGIKYNGRFVSILISHVGIDSDMFRRTAACDAVHQQAAALRAQHPGRKIVIGLGDLDSVKGGLLKFQAYDRFLARYPQWRDSMVFVEILLPNTSVALGHAQDMGVLLRAEVAAIHAKYGRECFHLMELPSPLPLDQAVAHFQAADVCIASQFWDGLNLTPFEYTASQAPDDPGALVISEFMGCSRTLNGVLRVNPWSLDTVANAIHVALGMSIDERKVMNHTIERWGVTFLEHLDRATRLCEGMNYVQVGWGSNVKLMGLRSDFTHLDEEAVTAAYRRAERRVLLLDYDGTLTPAEKTTHKSRLMGPSKTVRRVLQALSSDPDNVVYIMSGRTRSTLTEWFPASDFPDLGLAAEKGLFLRQPQKLRKPAAPGLRSPLGISSASLTSEARSQAFIEKLQQQQRRREAADEASAAAASAAAGGSAASASLSGDAHLLIEEACVPVDDSEWTNMIAFDDVSWKSVALEIIRSYTEQTDGSWIEDKEFAIVWHYEQADPEYGRMQASELQKYLVKILANPAVDVIRYDYNRILEVKPHGVSKGLAATAILEDLHKLHREKLGSRPTSPLPAEAADLYGRSRMASPSPPRSPGLGPLRGRSSASGSQVGAALANAAAASAAAAAALSPFIFCVGDDRSDEDMFLSVQNKDYLESKIRPAHLHSQLALMHTHGSTGSILPSQDAIKRSMSAAATVQHSRNSSSVGKDRGNKSSGGGGGNGELDEKTARERRKNRITDPFTFTVCVGMKPSNAHYYLHDDEEVVRLLQALGTSSQRMAQSRDADRRAQAQSGLLTIPSPPSAGSASGTASSARHSSSGANAWAALRPADIPTSPMIPTTPATAQYAMQQATAQLRRHQQQQQQQPLSRMAQTQRRRATSMSGSESDPLGDDDDDDDEDESDEEFVQRKPPRMAVMAGGGGMRRM